MSAARATRWRRASTSMRRAVMAFGILALAGCGDGCVCTNIAKSATKQPPPEEVRRVVIERLATDAKAARSLCGVSWVTGLRDVEAEVQPAAVGAPRVKISGKPIAGDAGAPDDDDDDDAGGGDAATATAASDAGARDAGPRDAAAEAGHADAGPPVAAGSGAAIAVTDPSKLALCSGVVAVTALAVYASDGTIKEWRYHDLDVESVTTPGVTFTKDGAGTSGSRRRRHHHHH